MSLHLPEGGAPCFAHGEAHRAHARVSRCAPPTQNYGARYFNPRTSMWVSADPALGDYLPVAPVDDDARKHNENLPGMGGVFNLVNLAVYHYAGNNPIRYTDPDGKAQDDIALGLVKETSPSLVSRIITDAQKYSNYSYLLGARIGDDGASYKYDASSGTMKKLDTKSVDCSGLVARVYQDVFGVTDLSGKTSQQQPKEFKKSDKAVVGGLMSFVRTSDKDPHIAIVTAVDDSGNPTRVLEAVSPYDSKAEGKRIGGVVEHPIPSNYLNYNPIYTKPPEEQ